MCSDDSVEFNPAESLDEFTRKYHADEENRVDEFADYQKAKRAHTEDSTVAPEIERSESGTISRVLVRIARKGRFADESEVKRLLKMPSQQVGGIPSFVFPDEEGVEKPMCVFPDDGTEAAARLRECEIVSEVEVFKSTLSLERARCFGKNQGDAHYRKLLAEQVQRRPGMLKASTADG